MQIVNVSPRKAVCGNWQAFSGKISGKIEKGTPLHWAAYISCWAPLFLFIFITMQNRNNTLAKSEILKYLQINTKNYSFSHRLSI